MTRSRLPMLGFVAISIPGGRLGSPHRDPNRTIQDPGRVGRSEVMLGTRTQGPMVRHYRHGRPLQPHQSEPVQYEFRAERTGFKTAMQRGVVLSVGGTAVLDVALEVGTVTETVEVNQEEPLLDTTKADVRRGIHRQSIDSLPIIGRNFVDFAKLSSAVAPGRENTGGGAFKEPDTGVGAAAAPRLTFGGQSNLVLYSGGWCGQHPNFHRTATRHSLTGSGTGISHTKLTSSRIWPRTGGSLTS